MVFSYPPTVAQMFTEYLMIHPHVPLTKFELFFWDEPVIILNTIYYYCWDVSAP